MDSELLTLKAVGIAGDPEENGKTFEENAIKKADFYSRFTDLPVLAEDSGLEVDFLNGEPGIYSRRWPSSVSQGGITAIKPVPEKSDEELIKILLEKLAGAPRDQRGAQFRVVIALKPDAAAVPILAEGVMRGRITEGLRAKIIPGFPFRSVFYVEALGKTLGELSLEEESQFAAHRRMALNQLTEELRKIGR